MEEALTSIEDDIRMLHLMHLCHHEVIRCIVASSGLYEMIESRKVTNAQNFGSDYESLQMRLALGSDR